ncbi:MAG: hypothetical protein ACOC6Q_02270 [Patescibacteria group bacterium]
MVSKTLLKLIDKAILPAVLLLAGKILGIAVFVIRHNLDFTLNLSSYPPSTIIRINTYSNLYAYGAIAVGFSIILIRSYILHQSHISPQLTVRLHKLDLTGIISTTYELFHQAIVWLSYMWLLSILFLLQAYWNLISVQVALAVLTFSIVQTIIFIRDVDRELNIIRI